MRAQAQAKPAASGSPEPLSADRGGRGALKRRAFVLLCALALGSAALPLRAHADDKKPSDADRKRWQELTPEQREKLRERHREFEKLPPEEQKRVRKNFKRWQKLSPEQKDATRERYKRWQELPPEKREQLRERWRSLSPEEKKKVRKQGRGRKGKPE